MSVYKPKGRRTFIYDFWYAGVHYKDSTHQTTKAEGKLVEDRLKQKLRHQRGGIADADPMPFTTWAGIVYEHLVKQQKRTGKPKRLDRIDEEQRVVLRFFGEKPTDPASPVLPAPGEEAPFHNLALQDLVESPEWLLEFDEWIDRRNVAGDTRNHYYTAVARMYRIARLPAYRKLTGNPLNPVADLPRAPKGKRKVAVSPAQFNVWLDQMSYHTRVSVAIAMLAPALRLENVLQLDKDRHLDVALTLITIEDHKTAGVTLEPIVQPVSEQLRQILVDAIARMAPGTTRIVQYRGRPLKSVRAGVAAAARAAGIAYGRFVKGGVTFHTIRHSASTILAGLDVNQWLHRDAIGHRDLTTTEGYTHLQAEQQRPVLEQLSAALPILGLVTAPHCRARRTAAAAAGGVVKGPEISDTEKPEEMRRLTRGALALAGRRFTRKG